MIGAPPDHSAAPPEDDPLAEIRAGFLAWLDAEIAAIETMAKRLDGEPSNARSLMSSIYKSSHEIKGLGTSFGYAELTDAGASLCRYLKHVGAAAPDIPLILDHAGAMRRRLAGQDGLEEILRALAQRVARRLP